MVHGLRNAVKVSGLSILPLVLAGCFLSSLRGCVDPETGAGKVTASFKSSACFQETESGDKVLVRCPIDLDPGDADSGFFVAEYLISFGVSPLLALFIDPLVVQFPNNVTNFAGTFEKTDAPTAQGNLVLSTASCIKTEPGKQLCAEPGHQLVIAELPSGMEQGTFNVSLTFSVNPAGPVAVKPVLTGKVVVGGETFYPLLLPCVTGFADVPAVTIPTALSLMDLSLPFDNIQACQGTLSFAAARAAPALRWSWMIGLAALLFAAGLCRVRRLRPRMG